MKAFIPQRCWYRCLTFLENGAYLLALLLLLLLSISKWVTQKARSLHKVVPSRCTHTITTTKEAILYNTHTSILTHIQLQQKIIFTTRIHNTLYN